MHNDLRDYIEAKIQIPEEAYTQFLSNFEEIELKKKDHLLQEGKICRNYFFIKSGLLRTYYINHKGKEVITSFAIERWWVTDVESFFSQKPSHVYIQALEATQLLAISYESLEKVYREIPIINNLFRLITQNTLVAFQRRHNVYLKMSSKERYEAIRKQIPEFIQRIPQHMLASYLDITPEYLSELRRK